MTRLTAKNLVDEIEQLFDEDPGRLYRYVTGNNELQIIDIEKPEGPITFSRKNTQGASSTARISKSQLARVAEACSNRPNFPLHIDRLFSAGNNNRSALETLLVHTPHFFICYPERIDAYSGKVRRNLKHLLWRPDQEHALGVKGETVCDEVITELEFGLDFGPVHLTAKSLGSEFDSVEAKGMHTRIQIALVEIGKALGFRTWIAKSDRPIVVGNTRLGQWEGVIQSLEEMPILYTKRIKEAAQNIDCIWFAEDGNRIPALMEIEHTTGITSGLDRMQTFRALAPAIETTFTIVAPDNLRNQVVTKANKQPISKELKARFMPYSAVTTLYGLIQRYTLSDLVDHRFIQAFMEQVVKE